MVGLYAGYADFYQVVQTAEMRDTVWSWLHDKTHEVKGFIAVNDAGNAVGLAHYRPFSRPLSATVAGFRTTCLSAQPLAVTKPASN